MQWNYYYGGSSMDKLIMFASFIPFVAIPILLIRALISFIKDRNNKYQWIRPLSYSFFFIYFALLNTDSNWLFYAGWLLMVFSLFLDHIADKYKIGINVFNPSDTSKKKAILYKVTLYIFPVVILLIISLYFIIPQKY